MADKEQQSGNKQKASAAIRNTTEATVADSEHAATLPTDPTPPRLAPAPLAYENHQFLNSAEGRLLRIVAEYSEPLARFRRERIQDTVVFFGSARFRGREEADHELECSTDNFPVRRLAPLPVEEQPASPPRYRRSWC